MAFLNSLKRAFGVAGEDDIELEFDEPEATAEALQMPPELAAPTELPEDAPVEVLDAILTVVNESLAPIVRESIDQQRQRLWLYGRLGQPLTTFVERLRKQATEKLTGDRTKMQTELEEMRAERKELANRREEQKANLLSEQRQRRALQERNRDLEQKIAELDGEIEQHRLTISSLMNKLRVSEVNQ